MYGGKCYYTSIILSVFYSELNLLGSSLWFAILFDSVHHEHESNVRQLNCFLQIKHVLVACNTDHIYF